LGGKRRERKSGRRRDLVVQSTGPRAKNMNRIRTLIDRLDRSLRDPASPVSVIIQDCLTLARVAEEREWLRYFSLQLLGVKLGRHPESSPALSTGDPKTFNWQPGIRFAEDRTGADKQMQGGSVQHLETFLRNAEADLSEGDDDLTAQIKKHNVFFRLDSLKARAATKDCMREATECLDVARTRAREFVSLMDAKEHEVMSDKGPSQSRIFIGHGRAAIWQTLALFLSERLSLPYEEFNRKPVAGRSIVERLEEMLGLASFAFIVFTGEDEGADGSLHARENVVHEAGLFQGRLGFRKAIILREDGCHEFSNIQGLVQIRFPRGDIENSYEQIRGVLEREGLL
jgi:predicted nucleotide-binding protein